MPPSQLNTEEPARVRRQRLEQKNRQLDEAIAAASIVVDSRTVPTTSKKGKKKAKQYPKFTVIEAESDPEPESSAMALQRPRAVPKSKLLFVEPDDEPEDIGVEQESEDSEDMELDDEVAVKKPDAVAPRRSTRITHRKKYDFESSEDEELTKKTRARRPVRAEKVPMEYFKDCIEDETRFHLSLSLEHNLNAPEGSPEVPPGATKYDIDWLINAIREGTPITRIYSKSNEVRSSVSDPSDKAEEMEIISAKQCQLRKDYEKMHMIQIKNRNQKQTTLLRLAIENRISCLDENLDLLRDFRAEREEYWQRKEEEDDMMEEEEELQEKVKILHAFNADRENNKLRPKVHHQKPVDSPSPLPRLWATPKKRSHSPDEKPRKAKYVPLDSKLGARSTPSEQNAEAKEPKSTPRLLLVCRIAAEKQRELDQMIVQAQKLQEELLKLTAEVEKISLEECGRGKEAESPRKIQKISKPPSLAVKVPKSPSSPITINSTPSPPITVDSTPSPVAKVRSTSPSPLLPMRRFEYEYPPDTDSEDESSDVSSETKYLLKKVSAREQMLYKKKLLGGNGERVRGHPAKKEKLGVRKKDIEQPPAVADPTPAPSTKPTQTKAPEPRVVAKPTSILPAKRKIKREAEEPIGKVVGRTEPLSKKTKLQKEMCQTIDDLQSFFKMDEYKPGKGAAASKK
ncbi:hypothetical protein TWF506_003888 [Arthrobotrys conoides]|uniref:Uncharacterized protein n=1 Tax=Arthrobotrys conoides TaxID=74498 RepID=A0AAN8MX58_9PEZI